MSFSTQRNQQRYIEELEEQLDEKDTAIDLLEKSEADMKTQIESLKAIIKYHENRN